MSDLAGYRAVLDDLSLDNISLTTVLSASR